MDDKGVCIYGPVASRRLGSSLGVDLVPRKTCDYDCIYCQLGRTTRKTTRREPYIPAGEVLEQLQRRLEDESGIDYITIAGSGEPTLHSELGAVIAGIRRSSTLPIAVITNGSLLGDEEVAEACCGADLIVPSLDAADEEMFQAVNRPCRELSLGKAIEGMASFRKAFHGDIWLEVMVVKDLNAGDEHMRKLRRHIAALAPDKVHLNTVVRPAAESIARPVEEAELARLAALLGTGADAVPPLSPAISVSSIGARRQKVLQLVRRRPCSAEDVAAALGVNYTEAMKVLARMEAEGSLSRKVQEGKIFYTAL